MLEYSKKNKLGEMADIQKNSEESGASFDAVQSSALLKVARLPEVYETELHKNDKNSAVNAVMSNLPDGIKPENVYILQRDNVTAIITHDPKTNTATVTMDPTSSDGSFPFNADKRDAFFRGPEETSLGAKAHGGFLNKLVKEDNNGTTLVERLEGVLLDLGSRQETPLTVNFTGFSKGGAQAMLVAGEMMGNGLFDNNPNIKLGTLQAFSPPGFASPEYAAIFNAKVKELGGNAVTTELHGDKTPTILTPQADSIFTRYDYGHVGQHAYIKPAEGGKSGEVIMDPDSERLKSLRDSVQADDKKHTIDVLLNSIESVKPQETKEQTLTSLPQPSQQTVVNSYSM